MKNLNIDIISKFKFPFENKNLSAKLILLLEDAGNKKIRENNTEKKYCPANEDHLRAYKKFLGYQSRGNIAAIGEGPDKPGKGYPVWIAKKDIIFTDGNAIPSREYWPAGTILLFVRKAA